MTDFVIPMLGLTPHGGNRVLVEIANELAQRGVPVAIVAPNRPISMPYRLDPRVDVRLLGPKLPGRILPWLFFLFRLPAVLAGKRVLANQFLTVPPSWVAATFFGASYLYFVQGIEHRVHQGLLSPLLRALSGWTYRRGNVVAANAYLEKELLAYGPVELTLKLGVSDIFFSTPASSILPDYDVIYFLRREVYKRRDRFDALLPALLNKGYRVLCVSQDRDLLDEYALRTGTLKPFDDIELVRAIDSAKLLLLTSDHEGFSLPPLEAMARGKPTVMYPCGGPEAYAVDQVNCLVVKNLSDENALACIDQLICDQALYDGIADQCKATASGFQLQDAVRKLVDRWMRGA